VEPAWTLTTPPTLVDVSAASCLPEHSADPPSPAAAKEPDKLAALEQKLDAFSKA
jgi:hypothetical protein